METETDRHSENCTDLDRKLAVPMFVVALLFLLTTGAFLHLTAGDLTCSTALWCYAILAVLYVAIIGEWILHWVNKGRNLKQHIKFALMPILRLSIRDHVTGEMAWIPFVGWRRRTKYLEQFLSRRFSGPMIIIALFVLPVVGIEFFYADYIAADPVRLNLINLCSAFIWMAFVLEFVIMVSIVENKVLYCRQNWIDVAVVLLPLVSFMGAARLGRLVKLKQLSRTAKIYRMRGLALRSWRAIVALDVIDTVLRRTPEQKMERIEEQIQEKEKEIQELKEQLDRMKQVDAKADAKPPANEIVHSSDQDPETPVRNAS